MHLELELALSTLSRPDVQHGRRRHLKSHHSSLQQTCQCGHRQQGNLGMGSQQGGYALHLRSVSCQLDGQCCHTQSAQQAMETATHVKAGL